MPTLPTTLASLHLLSPHLESLLLTYLLNALWQVPLLFLAAQLAARATHRAGPAFHHALWTTTLFAQILLPALSTRTLQLLLDSLSLRHPTPTPTTHITITIGDVHAATGFQIPPSLLTAAALLYLATTAFFALRLATGLHQTHTLRRRSQPLVLTGPARESYHRLAQLFAVPNGRLAASPDIATPITLGIRHPTLLLPAHLEHTLLPEDLAAALAHEFAHIHRRDFAKNLLYQLLSLPIAFHPIAWLTRRHLSETRELICDNLAATAVAGPQRYARSLLRLATQFSQHPSPRNPAPQAIGIFNAHPFKNFERRIMNLTHHPLELRGPARLLPTTLAVILITAACTSALAFRQQVTVPQSDIGQVPASVQAGIPPAGSPPHSVVLAIPRSTTGQPAQSFKVDIADANGPHPAVKVLTPPYTEPTQADTGHDPHVSAGIIAGNRITFVGPVYPEDAKKAKLSGTVVLHAIIDKDGTIKTLNVLTSTNPIFNDSALDAVRKWTYKSYLLNGEPTAVDTTITLNYALAPPPQPQPSPTPNPSASNAQTIAAPNQPMHIGGEVTRPIVIRQGEPEFTQQAKDARFSGTVRVSLQVDTNGHTSHIRVVKGVGMGLDEKAIEAVSRYQFQPATFRGRPVPVNLYIDVNFQIL